MDGCSIDRTMEIVNRYKDEIDIIISEKDNGISDAFNKGIRLANGNIIALLNSDDILRPGAFDCLIDNFDHNVDIYRGEMTVWNSLTGEKRHIVPSMNLMPGCHKIFYAHPSTFITKAAYEKYGLYDVNCKMKMDIDLLTRMARAGVVMKYIPFEFVDFRTGGVSTRKSRDIKLLKASIKEAMYFYDKNQIGLLSRIYDFARLLVKFVLCR